MGWSSPRTDLITKDGEEFGRILLEGQKEGRDERPSTDHNEKREAGEHWDLPELQDQDLQNWKGGGINGRLLFEGQEEGRDEGPQADHDEERQAGNGGDLPVLRDEDLQDRQVDLSNNQIRAAHFERSFFISAAKLLSAAPMHRAGLPLQTRPHRHRAS